LRAGIEPEDLEAFGRVLGRMYANVTGGGSLDREARPVNL
jgi:hypothetical protein